MENTIEKLENWSKKYNSSKLFEEFKEALKSGDNNIIEKTEVYRYLKKITDKNNKIFIKDLISSQISLYRSRKIEIADFKNPNQRITLVGNKIQGYNKFDSKEPPLSFPKAGRNNILGISYLYLSEDEYTSITEIKPNQGSLVSVAKFDLLENVKLIDFSVDENVSALKDTNSENYSVGELITQIMFEFTRTISTEEEYFCSQYIADFIRKNGFDGIRYLSSQSNGYNITLFNCSENVIKFKESYVVMVRNKYFNIYDVSNNRDIKVNKEFCKELTENEKKIIKHRIIAEIING